MVFTTEGLFEVAIESWPEWDLNLRPLNSVQIFGIYTYKYINVYVYIYTIELLDRYSGILQRFL